jgi:hypothetical protein
MTVDERQVVSRKTPLDGRLEISEGAALQLSELGDAVALRCQGREATAGLSSLRCTCAKGAGAGHVHHFVESDVLRALLPGTEVRVVFDADRGKLEIEPTA